MRKPRSGPRRPRTVAGNAYTELTYQPMQEVLSYLRANGFKTYIVTGGGQDFVALFRAGLRHPARAGGRHRWQHQIQL